jgi:hypothetical protein
MTASVDLDLVQAADPFQGSPVLVNSGHGYNVQQFLAWEALLLDSKRQLEWIGLVAKDCVYRCPGQPEVERSWCAFVSRLRKAASTGTSPQTQVRTHRMLCNVLVSHGTRVDEFVASSYVLLNFHDPALTQGQILALGRRDLLCRVSNHRFVITRREVRMAPISPQTLELLGPP